MQNTLNTKRPPALPLATHKQLLLQCGVWMLTAAEAANETKATTVQHDTQPAVPPTRQSTAQRPNAVNAMNMRQHSYSPQNTPRHLHQTVAKALMHGTADDLYPPLALSTIYITHQHSQLPAAL
jgi:hypothetical protein